MTYEILDDDKAIKCLHCGLTSYHPKDVSELYCGKCHLFHEGLGSDDYPDWAYAEKIKLQKEIAELRAKLDQVDDVLVVNWIAVKDDDYRKALYDLITWSIQIHDDPTVSEVAAKRAAKQAALYLTLELVVGALSVIGGQQPSPALIWLKAFEPDDLIKMVREVMDSSIAALRGTGDWDTVDTIIYEWRESGLVAMSGVLDEALASPEGKEKPV